MNKKVFLIASLIIFCQTVFGQKNMDELFKNFAKKENVTRVKVDSGLMGLANLFADTMGVDEVEVLSFDKCDEEIKESLSTAIKEMKDPAFETMISTTEGGQRTKVLVRFKKEIIKEMVVVTSGKSHALIRIKGSIKPSDIERLINQYSNG